MYLLKLQQLKPSIYDVKVVSSFSVLGWMKSPVLSSSIVEQVEVDRTNNSGHQMRPKTCPAGFALLWWGSPHCSAGLDKFCPQSAAAPLATGAGLGSTFALIASMKLLCH